MSAPLDRGDAVNLARNVVECPSQTLTPRGHLTLAEAVLKLDAHVAALSAQSASAAIPEGCVLVPVEPTPEMTDAHSDVWMKFRANPDLTSQAVHAWRAMLLAAPANCTRGE